MNILITGGAGFVGSYIAKQLKSKYPSYNVIALDNLQRRGSEINVPFLVDNGINFIHGDIRNVEDFAGLKNIEIIIDASADPAVLSGINSNAAKPINTNLLGTLNLLELAAEHNSKFIFLSTSRVYSIPHLLEVGLTEQESGFRISENQNVNGVSSIGINEDFPTDGYKSFYGACKFSSEIIAHEYAQFRNIELVVNRCGVISGPGQFGKIDQGILVHWLLSHYWQRPLKYIGFNGSGNQARDILHIHDLFNLIDIQLHNFSKFNKQVFNVGGGLENTVSLKQLTWLCEKVTGKSLNISGEPDQRQADIPIYISDNTKISGLSSWRPKLSVEQCLRDTLEWVINNEDKLKYILRNQN